jgi:16S rRNA (guanine(966)-N(2))-methyltransferase RsmD
MRIIAGAHRGRTLKTPTWEGLRPTSDRLRETLFNILGSRVSGARVLDAYAGTGAVALEALSRGAASAVCLEQDRRAQALIADNRARLGSDAQCMILRVDARRALQAPIAGGPFDIVFLDPPYDDESLDELVALAVAQRAPGGIVVLEHASRRTPPAWHAQPPNRSVKAGDSTLSFYA